MRARLGFASGDLPAPANCTRAHTSASETRLAGDGLGGDGLDALGLGAEGDARDVLHQRRVACDALRQRREVAHPQRNALLGVRPQQLRPKQAARMVSS